MSSALATKPSHLQVVSNANLGLAGITSTSPQAPPRLQLLNSDSNDVVLSGSLEETETTSYAGVSYGRPNSTAHPYTIAVSGLVMLQEAIHRVTCTSVPEVVEIHGQRVALVPESDWLGVLDAAHLPLPSLAAYPMLDLSADEVVAVAELLRNPPAPNDALVRAFSRR